MARTFPSVLTTAGFLAIAAAAARGDLIHLKNGQVINGTLHRQGNSFMITPAKGQPLFVPVADVVQVQLTGGNTSAGQWHQLRRQVKQAATAKAALKKIRVYLAAHPTGKHVPAAMALLKIYKNYAAKGMVKFAGRWVSPDRIGKMQSHYDALALAGLRQYRNGQIRAALKSATAVLRADRTNSLALAVAGLAEYRLNHVPQSRRLFKRLATRHADGALAWNNMAVLDFTQRRQTVALAEYNHALDDASNNRIIVDNVAQALHFFKGSHRSFLYRTLTHKFTQSDRLLESRMARKGWYRYGSGWITQRQKRALDRFNTRNASLVRQLKGGFKSDLQRLRDTRQRLVRVQARIVNLENEIVSMNLAAQSGQAGLINPASVTIREADLQDLHTARAQRQALLRRERRLQTNIRHARRNAKRVYPTGLAVQYENEPEMLQPGQVRHPPQPLRTRLHLSTLLARLPAAEHHVRRRHRIPQQNGGNNSNADEQSYLNSYPYYPFGFFVPAFGTFPTEGQQPPTVPGVPTPPTPIPNPPPGPPPIQPPPVQPTPPNPVPAPGNSTPTPPTTPPPRMHPF